MSEAISAVAAEVVPNAAPAAPVPPAAPVASTSPAPVVISSSGISKKDIIVGVIIIVAFVGLVLLVQSANKEKNG